MSIRREDLERHLTDLFKPALFRDYGPNGLQIEGKGDIKNIAFAVSATRESIEAACKNGADAFIVHHGLFWEFHGVRTITGTFAKRVTPLINHKVNLFGYHLPLDAHMSLGNAASLASIIGLEDLQPFGDHKGMPTGVHGKLSHPTPSNKLKKSLETLLSHNVILSSPDETALITTIGIITGGANSGWKDAAKLGLDAFITGEISEHDWNDAKEAGVHMFAGGHYATEVFGIKTLMTHIQKTFPVKCFFIESSNPA